MRAGGWWYAESFAGSALVSLLLTPLVLRIALRRRILDHPGGYKAHGSPVPYLGGLAMVTAFALAVLVAAILRPPILGLGELAAVMGIAIALGVIGLLDDLRNVSPLARLLCEIGAAIGLLQLGVRVELFPGAWFDFLFTVAWVVGITNAFNLLDNMDGLAAGVAAIAAGSIFLIASLEGQFLVAGLAAATAGCAIGFLRHNFFPARIYMGDSGALFLGFIIAYLGIKLRFNGTTETTFLVPMLILGVAILDTTLVTVCRLLRRRSPFQGGRDHVSHRLVAVGIPVPAAVALIYVAAASLGVVALVVSRIDRASAYMLAALVLGLGAFVGVLLAQVPIYKEEKARNVFGRRVVPLELVDPPTTEGPPEAEAS